MSISVVSLMFMWLLQSQAASTESPDETLNVTTETTGEATGEAAGEAAGPSTTGHMLMHNLSTSSPAAEASGQTAEATLSTAHTAPASSLKTFPTNVQMAATATSSTSPQFISTAVRQTSNTEVEFKTTKSPTFGTSHASHSDTATAAPPEGSTGQTSTTHRPTTPTHRISTTTQSTEPPAESESPSPGPATTTVTKSPIYAATTNQRGETSDKETNHGKVVAGLIGGALLLMMVGFLLIFVKKRRIQKQQISATEWAGPSPFLEGGADSEQVERRVSNRISLSSFLPQRLSKRLSLLPETEEELRDMTSGTTFGDQRCTFGREDVKGSNGTAGGEIQSTEDAPETGGNSSPSITEQTPNLSDDPADPPAATKAEENPLVQNSNDLK